MALYFPIYMNSQKLFGIIVAVSIIITTHIKTDAILQFITQACIHNGIYEDIFEVYLQVAAY